MKNNITNKSSSSSSSSAGVVVYHNNNKKRMKKRIIWFVCGMIFGGSFVLILLKETKCIEQIQSQQYKQRGIITQQQQVLVNNNNNNKFQKQDILIYNNNYNDNNDDDDENNEESLQQKKKKQVVSDWLRNEQQKKASSSSSIKTLNSNNTAPDFILGLSTGHAGSTTYHTVMTRNNPSSSVEEGENCPWSNSKTGGFEWLGPNEKQQIYHNNNNTNNNNESESSSSSSSLLLLEDCNYTNNVLIPFMEFKRYKKKKSKTRSRQDSSMTYIDLGHFHNRIPNGLECLAQNLGSRLVYIRIRRNRYDIARSFTKRGPTPCHNDIPKKKHPSISYCPKSTEQHGPTYLPIDDDNTWDNHLSLFQKYLWLVDEMEIRSDYIKRTYPSTTIYETTWSTSEEFRTGINNVKQLLGCTIITTDNNNNNNTPTNATTTTTKSLLPNQRKHISHKESSRNCSQQILQDLEYRKIMNFTTQQYQILFVNHKQRIGGSECIESSEELRDLLLSNSEDLTNWIIV